MSNEIRGRGATFGSDELHSPWVVVRRQKPPQILKEYRAIGAEIAISEAICAPGRLRLSAADAVVNHQTQKRRKIYHRRE
jgi:hypothetical protein